MRFEYKVPGDGDDAVVEDVPAGFLFEQGGVLYVRPTDPGVNVLQPPPNPGDVPAVTADTFQPLWLSGTLPCVKFGRVQVVR